MGLRDKSKRYLCSLRHNFLKAWLHNSIFLNKVKQHLGPIERGAHQASYGGVEDLAQKIQSRGYLYQNVMGE